MRKKAFTVFSNARFYHSLTRARSLCAHFCTGSSCLPLYAHSFMQDGGGGDGSNSDVEIGGKSSQRSGSGSGGLRQRGGSSSSTSANGIARLPPFAKHQRVAKVADTVDRW
jgi:hypothetical protein